MRRLTSALLRNVQEIPLPTLMKDAEIAVYLVHNSRDPEDYFFLFDFEEFVDRSRGGFFVRPALRIFAGRDDFSRTKFARQFREVFAREFDRMRAELAQANSKRGWLDWLGGPVDLIAGLVGNLLLAVALSVGRSLIGRVSVPGFLKGRSAEAKLADEIDRTKGQVEAALARIEITLHRELYEYAYRDGPAGRISGLDREAWPLPAYVRAHLGQGESGSWW